MQTLMISICRDSFKMLRSWVQCGRHFFPFCTKLTVRPDLEDARFICGVARGKHKDIQYSRGTFAVILYTIGDCCWYCCCCVTAVAWLTRYFCFRCDGFVRAIGGHGPVVPSVPHRQGLPQPRAVSEAACKGIRNDNDVLLTTIVDFEVLVYFDTAMPSDGS